MIIVRVEGRPKTLSIKIGGTSWHFPSTHSVFRVDDRDVSHIFGSGSFRPISEHEVKQFAGDIFVVQRFGAALKHG